MSRAFVKETAESAAPPERMVDDGPNLVTAEGLAAINAHVARIESAMKAEANVLLRETLARDLRYWTLRQASAQLPRFAKPRYLRQMDSLPKTATGKIQRAVLRQQGSAGAYDAEAAPAR